ncbi:hypothetical protein E2C01_037063 [Portunus trituberculatus]|uniref:Uncharacterized protein n=1 Tax=Portunus trituberculatus TaxID=210409 RepID=A0A5B7FDM0_PORTR|nr:hypothetical protein [Portunus trituberculatus]
MEWTRTNQPHSTANEAVEDETAGGVPRLGETVSTSRHDASDKPRHATPHHATPHHDRTTQNSTTTQHLSHVTPRLAHHTTTTSLLIHVTQRHARQ